MKRKIILSALCAILFGVHIAFAQQEILSEKTDITYNEVVDHIEKLIGSGTEEASIQLRAEAETLAKSQDEDFRALSALMYERLFNDGDKAQAIRDEIEVIFPQGKFVRAREFAQLFTDESLSASEMAQKYGALLEKFPKEKFKLEDQEIYDHAILELSAKYAEENNVNSAIEQAASLENGNYFVVGITNIYENLPDKKASTPLHPLVERAYKKSLAAKHAENEEANLSYDAMFLDPISAVYGDVLLQSGKLDEALQVANERLESIGLEEVNVSRHLVTAVLALEQQNKKKEALGLLEEHLVAAERTPEMVDAFKRLYVEVNGAGADPAVALSKIDSAAREAVYAQYTQEMIHEEAPSFSLVDREGKTVSLSDYKGKVVVLDFWATWCGPCVVSFPGMQATVDKYQHDPEVAFLFIDTWQNEENYKELVDEFIATNGYSFHVLFDEMKDRSKAVATAFDVEGIPTKVIIDKNGFIRFRSTGGNQDVAKAVAEMEAKIELAKKG